MKDNKDFAVFIMTHGRPDKVVTYKALKKAGYTGRIIILIDNEDKDASKYIENYGDEVYIFDKAALDDRIKRCDNFGGRHTILYARKACYDVAKLFGITYFMQIDDDYTDFRYKFNANGDYGDWTIKNIDTVFEKTLEYYKSISAKSIAFAQGGDFIGGGNGTNARMKPLRKCMNTFFCSTDREIDFIGRLNDDVTSYTLYGSQGSLFLTLTNVAINQLQTQSVSGGMTDVYQDNGTYVKSFYSLMIHPSSIKIKLMGSSHKRLHHSVTWKNTVPKIVDEKYRKISKKVIQDDKV